MIQTGVLYLITPSIFDEIAGLNANRYSERGGTPTTAFSNSAELHPREPICFEARLGSLDAVAVASLWFVFFTGVLTPDPTIKFIAVLERNSGPLKAGSAIGPESEEEAQGL
ncbi:hypothetical protein N7463_007007 [Penicillium fimorum]|uniref:Uncharacterized protein n=1 Tax=Penicillium fimorum TaxID=1882269 RepID=A0A9W9XVH8_9EURO|nr:hypothetical protein N7463_007007 [Penicillium fimorum]